MCRSASFLPLLYPASPEFVACVHCDIIVCAGCGVFVWTTAQCRIRKCSDDCLGRLKPCYLGNAVSAHCALQSTVGSVSVNHLGGVPA